MSDKLPIKLCTQSGRVLAYCSSFEQAAALICYADAGAEASIFIDGGPQLWNGRSEDGKTRSCTKSCAKVLRDRAMDKALECIKSLKEKD